MKKPAAELDAKFSSLVARRRATNKARHRARKQKRERARTVKLERQSRTVPPDARPNLTSAKAREFALLLASGVDPLNALRYMAPSAFDRMADDERTDWLNALAGDRLVLRAVNELNGAEWHHLDADKRLQLALDKHFSELAYLLYTTSYRTAEGSILRKIDNAAERLMKYLTESDGGGEGADSGWRAFVGEIMKQYESSTSPPTLPVPAETNFSQKN